MNKINSKDISVVVQGAINKELTPKCLKSIRKFLPNAKIILSTWKNSKVENLDYDILVENDDPGYVILDDVYKIPNNVNRQILSSKNALKKVQTKYTLKMRSDMIITNLNFVKFFEIYNKLNRCEDFKISKERFVINNLYCADPERTRLPFHISDWFQFGLSEDILNLWDIPLQKEPQTTRYFCSHKKPDNDLHNTWLFKYVPEQYITISFIKKKNNINLEYYNDAKEENIIQTYKFFANNCIILDYKICGIKFLKYDPYKHDYTAQMSHYKWLMQYKKYCNPNFIIPIKYTWQDDLHLPKYLNKLQKHWKRFLIPFVIIGNSIGGFIGVVYYILHTIFNLIIFMPRLLYKLFKNIFQQEK